MADNQIISFGMDLNQPPLVDDSLAIVPVLEPTPLVVRATGSPTMPKFVSRRFLCH
jgi:hypothetical protein